MQDMPPKERTFCSHFLETFDPKYSAQAAGYQPSYGCRLLAKPAIREHLRELARTKEHLSPARLLRELEAIATSIHDAKTIKASDKLKAIQMLMSSTNNIADKPDPIEEKLVDLESDYRTSQTDQ